jgi:transcription antitermination factor NusG
METGVVVAESGQNAQTVNEDFELFVGDFIEFTAGPYTGTKGMIYYLDEELLIV